MASKLETLAPILAAMPGGDQPLTPGDEESADRIRAALEAVAAPDLECVMSGPMGFVAEHRGVEGLLEAWADWLSPYRSYRIELEDVIESGDRVVTMVRQFGTPAAGGPEVENAGGAVWTVRDDRLVRVEFHLDREDARRAAGLS